MSPPSEEDDEPIEVEPEPRRRAMSVTPIDPNLLKKGNTSTSVKEAKKGVRMSVTGVGTNFSKN